MNRHVNGPLPKVVEGFYKIKQDFFIFCQIYILKGVMNLTAEVAILNKYGVALAADSAVTIGNETKNKVYNSANKLFALSKKFPVGIMIYGNAEYMSIPWEVIIRDYREQHGNIEFDNLSECAFNFIEFIKSNDNYKSEEAEQIFVHKTFSSVFQDILNNVNGEINKKFNGSPQENQVVELIREQFEFFKNQFENKYQFLDDFNSDFVGLFITKHKDIMDQIIAQRVFVPLSDEIKDKIYHVGAYIFSKDFFFNELSGITITGYGKEEIFPRLFEFHIGGMICDKLKYKEATHTIINIIDKQNGVECPAAVRAFAQRQMVHSFMSGIDPSLQRKIQGLLKGLFDQIPGILNNNLQKPLDQNSKKLADDIFDKVLNLFEVELNKVKQNEYINPIVETVEILPKEELAPMAEALLNLTSIKRRISKDAESVGGPIDVAVISKGDGFVWVKRKHYFKPELNYQFFQNY